MKKSSVESLSLTGIAIVWLMLLALAGVARYRAVSLAETAIQVEHAHDAITWFEEVRDGLKRLKAETRSDLHGLVADANSPAGSFRHLVDSKLSAMEKLSDDGHGRRQRLQQLQQLIRNQIFLSQPAGEQLITGAAKVNDEVLMQAVVLADGGIRAEQNLLLQLKQAGKNQKLMVRIVFFFLLTFLAIFSTYILLKMRNVINSRAQAFRHLGESEQRYRQIVETANEGIWMVDAQGQTTFANQRLADMLGYRLEEIEGTSFFTFMDDIARQEAAILFAECAQGMSVIHDFRFRHHDGSDLWVIASTRPLSDAQEKFIGALCMLTDITERKSAECALAEAHAMLEERIDQRTAELVAANVRLSAEIAVRENTEDALATSEDRFHEVLTMMPLSVFIKDAQLNILLMNEACEQQWGITLTEVRGTDGSAFFPTEQMARFFANDKTAFDSRKMVVVEGLVWSGTLQENRLVQTFKKPIFDAQGKPQYLIGASIDITENRRTEDALQHSFLQLRKLTEHQENIKEDERQRIARDIHDDLGQNLLALKIDIGLLQARIGTGDQDLNSKIKRVLTTIDTSIHSVRTIINDLHPSTLALGLCPAVEWLLTNFELRTGVTATLELTGDQADTSLDDRHTLAIFRIIQESLVNIARHAKASEVQIALEINAHRLQVVIEDNGIGIRPDDRRKSGSFGIKGIQERIEAFGGEFAIATKDTGGTTLSFSIPLTEIET